MSTLSRRGVLAGIAAGPWLASPTLAQASANVVVVGGGFGGASAARALKRAGLDLYRLPVQQRGHRWAATDGAPNLRL